MNEKNLTITNLHQLMDYDVRKFIIAEIQLKSILKEWINIASSLKLKTVLQKYHDLVEQHAQIMEKFSEQEDAAPLNISNKVMHAFIEEAGEKLNRCTDAAIKDACLLASIQAINHYKISTYGTAAAFAKALEMEEVAADFHRAEVNEKQIDDRLSQLAEHEINSNAKTTIAIPG